MTKLRVSSRFAVRGIWIQPTALGRTFEWVVDDREVALMLPRGQGDFVNPEETEVPVVPAWLPTARIENSGEAVAIQLLGVDVTYDGSISAADKERALAPNQQRADAEADAREFSRAAQLAWGEGHELAERTAHLWLTHVRVVASQPWLGIAVEPPMQYGRSHIFDDDAGVRLMSFGPEKSATIRSGQVALSVEQLESIADAVSAGREPETAETLLADAHFLAQEAEVVDAQRATLIAAAACEIKTKQTMRVHVQDEKSALLDLVLRRVSNLPQLLDQPLRAALNVSLKEADPELFDRVRRLSDLRNQVVHGGITVDKTEGWQLVVAAGQLFAWLDELGARSEADVSGS